MRHTPNSQVLQMVFHRAFIPPNEKILVEMTLMNRCDMEVVQAYNGLYFPLENTKRRKKEKKERAWENK